MLISFNSLNESFHEVNVSPRMPTYRLVSVELFRLLMRRTGNGAPVTLRQLAAAAGIPHGTIGNLLTGQQETVPQPTALALAQRLGVDLLVAFEPVSRSTTAPAEYAVLTRADEEVSA
jgi:transcriptional regulator with XRE-family HTH domain